MNDLKGVEIVFFFVVGSVGVLLGMLDGFFCVVEEVGFIVEVVVGVF